MRVVLAIAVVAAWSSSARPAEAGTPTLVSWRAPVGCGDEAALRDAIVARAGGAPEAAAPYAIVDVEPTGATVTAHVAIRTPIGVVQRVRTGATCDAVADAVASLIAMAWRTAAPGPKLLSWTAPADCPDQLEVRATILARARRTDGEPPFATVEVIGSDLGPDFHATVRLERDGHSETRPVDATSCAEVADAVAWMVALAWPPPPPPPPPLPPPPPPPPASLWPYVSARTALDLGTLPGGDAGVGAAIGLVHRGGFAGELAGTYWAPRFDAVMAGSPAGVDIGLASLAAQGCARFACAGLEVGRLGGRGVAFDGAHDASLWWVAATAGARWRRALAPALGLVVDAGVVVPLGRPEFTFDSGGVAFRPAPLAGRLAVALEFFPFR